MTTQRRPAVRTPRKDKSWAYLRGTALALTTNNVEVLRDLLGDYETDLGLLATARVTAMRIVGSLNIGNNAGAIVSTRFEVYWGIAWVSALVAALPAADASIPDPGELGTREASWLQRGALYGKSVLGVDTLGAHEGQLRSFVNLDIGQMRKQPNAGDRLVLITRSTASSTEDATMTLDLATMLALP